jgi:hypothetical protein
MQLSPGVYSRLATILDPVRGGTDAAGSERRREPRMPVQGVGKVATPGAPVDGAATVQVHDVSLGGACLIASRDLAVGEQLVLVLEGRDGSAVSLLCSVAHCRPLSPDVYIIGAQFLHGQGTDGGHTGKSRKNATTPTLPRDGGGEPLSGSQRQRHLFNG